MMAYNYPYPYNQPNFQMQQAQQPMQMPTQQTPQIQTNGLIAVRTEDEARNYPVGYGNSVTFKNETEPYIYTKTMGFSQLDRPIFEKFKLVKEETEGGAKEVITKIDNSALDEIKADIESLWDEVKFLRDTRNKGTKKKEANDD